jgi:hypothetical protein
MDLKETACGDDVEWIHVFQDRDQWRALMDLSDCVKLPSDRLLY